MALAVILLVGAALMIRTFSSLRSVQPGFDSHNVITMQTSLTNGRYDTTAKAAQMIRQVTEHVEALPGVRGGGSHHHAAGGGRRRHAVRHRRPSARPTATPTTAMSSGASCSPHYFTAFRIPLLRGRAFDQRDTGNSEHVVIINQAMAKKYWPNDDPLGQRIDIGKGLGADFDEPPRQIVGIVGDARETGLSGRDQGVMYVPEAQVTDPLDSIGQQRNPA